MLKILAVLLFSAALATPAYADRPVQFSKCRQRGVKINCVIDGDSIYLNGIYTRMGDYDTPEARKGQYKCQAEKELGDRATRRLIEILNSGPVSAREWRRNRDADRSYFRPSKKPNPSRLRIVIVHGRSVGDTLISEAWRGHGSEGNASRGVSDTAHGAIASEWKARRESSTGGL